MDILCNSDKEITWELKTINLSPGNLRASPSERIKRYTPSLNDRPVAQTHLRREPVLLTVVACVCVMILPDPAPVS